MVIYAMLFAASPWSVAYACSCRPGTTLQQHYEGADNILVAKISGCAPDQLSNEGYCRNHSWSFETVENLKGSDARIRVSPAAAGTAISTCDLALKVGETYLLFLQDGRTDLCSGTGALSGDSGARKLREVEILRAYRNRTLSRITDPWHFLDSGWVCAIDHQLTGASIHFSYLYSLPPAILQQRGGTLQKPVPRMILRLDGPFEFVGPALFRVNDAPIPLTRTTSALPNGRKFSVDLVNGDAALALLDSMKPPAEIVVSGTRSTPHGASESFHTATDTAQVPELAAKFKACIAAHSDTNERQ